MCERFLNVRMFYTIVAIVYAIAGCNSFGISTTKTVHGMVSSLRSENRIATKKSFHLFARKTMIMDPIQVIEEDSMKGETTYRSPSLQSNSDDDFSPSLAIAPGTMTGIMIPFIANAADSTTRLINLNSFKAGLTVENFQPVCSASDNVYRVLQQTVAATVGPEKFVEYGPLIAGGLLRVRLELCVVESFISEAVVPFIRDNGVSWILPIHETVETFLAGAIFALATTFILIGSTKLVTVLITYTDFVFGLPSRLFGGFIFDRAQGKPVTLDIGIGPFQSRIIGPPKDKEIPALKVQDISPLAWIVLLLSGTVNYFGKFLQVSVFDVAFNHSSVLALVLTNLHILSRKKIKQSMDV
jgi:hypothetical protein